MTKLKNRIITIEEFDNSDGCILRLKQNIVNFPLTEEEQNLISVLKEDCLKLEGLGLSAPQVGINKSIAVIYIPDTAGLFRDNVVPYPIHTIINATYEPIASEGFCEDFEGCYSVRSWVGKVKRFNTIRVRYQNESGEVINKVETGFYARVLQHEIDHLNGILFIDRFDENTIYGTPNEMARIRRQNLSPKKQKEYDMLLRKKGYDID